MKKKVRYTEENHRVKAILHDLGLHTVCRSARCPNLSECFHEKRATFLILGDVCTRRCSFCAVEKAPGARNLAVDEGEPDRVAQAVRRLGIRYAVVTSVTRDDLEDGGAGQFARTILALRGLPQGPRVEVLTPDFFGSEESIRKVAEARPDVYNHNVETVPRLYPLVRPGAAFERSLSLLRFVRERFPGILTKSGLMVGIGETPEEVVEVLRRIRGSGCDAVTIGQYLRPKRWNIPVREYVSPDLFRFYREEAERLGFLHASSGPYVRSSYMAHEGYERLLRP